ncbi:MAG: two-component regulator propeller domain-containing protein [Chloroflexota bacterium]
MSKTYRFFLLFLFLLAACQKEDVVPASDAIPKSILTLADSQIGQWTNFRNPNFIYDLVVAETGVVWATGANGILRYDPNLEEAAYFTTQAGLPGNSNYSLTLAPDGTVLVLSQDKLVFFDNDAGQFSPLVNTPDAFQPFTMTIAPNGDMWFLEGWDTVRRFDGNNWEELQVGNANYIIRAAPDGTIWLAGRQLLSYDSHGWTEHPYPPDTIGEMGRHIYGFIVDQQHNIWLTTGSTDRSPILYKYSNHNWQEFDIWDMASDRGTLGIYLGEMWADPVEGIWYVTDKRSPGFDVHLTHFVDDEPKQTYSIRFPDLLAKSIGGFEALPDGSFWFGSQGYTQWGWTPPGLYHYSENLWEHVTIPTSIPDNRITDCARTDDGRLWFSTPSSLVNFDGRHWNSMSDQVGLPAWLSFLLPGANNTLWTSDTSGLIQVGPQIRQIKGDFLISAMATGNGQTVWLGGHGGSVWHFDGREFSYHPLSLPESFSSIEAMAAAPDNRVWVGLIQGHVLELRDDGWLNIGPDNVDSILTMRFADDKLWVVARLEGGGVPHLYAYDGESWQLYETELLNEADRVTTLLNASDNSLWLGTNNGVINYNPASRTGSRLTVEDGLVDNVVTALCEGPDGAIWIGTQAGLSHYLPNN